jgi:pyrroline-5-carboxylate reductase
MTHIAVLGGGVMGEALIAGLLQLDPKPSIVVVEKREDRAQELVDRYSISSADSRVAVTGAQVIIAVVKPQDMRAVLSEVSDAVSAGALIISIAAGVTTETIESLVPQAAVVRAMPNTPARIQQGVIGMSAGGSCESEQFAKAVELLCSVGVVLEIPELLQDAITATSGSGPAYVFYLAEAMIRGAEQSGLSQADARTAVIQTILGSAELLAASTQSPAELRANVTSPNGTTAAAIATFDEHGVREGIIAGMISARDRSAELSGS